MPTAPEKLQQVDVVVVGSGAAGTGAARHIQKSRPDLSLLVLEANDRPGGRAHTVHPAAIGGLPIDLGCGWLHGARTNAWTKIAEEVGLTVDHTPAPWSEGGRRLEDDTPEGDAAETAIDEFFERARQRAIRPPDGSLAEVLEPNNPWNERIEAIGTFLNGAALDQASIIDYNRYSPGEGPDWRVREGYGTTVARYGAPLDIRLNAPVTQIDHGHADHIILETALGRLRAKAVIVTVSTNMVAREVVRFFPPLPDKLDAASRLPLGLDNKLFLSVPEHFDLPADVNGYGSETSTGGSYQIRPFGRFLVEGYYGGALAHDLETAGFDASVDFAREELAKLLGSDVARAVKPVDMSAWASQRFIGGAYSYARPGAAFLREVLAAPVDDRLFFAGEACHSSRFSTAHGAYETGVAAAGMLLAAFAKAG